MNALAHVMVKRGGFQAVTPETIARAAGLGPEAFWHHFEDAESCYLALYDETLTALRESSTEGARASARAYDERDWRHRLDGAVGAVLAYLSGRPELAEAVTTHVASVGPAALARREAMLAEFVMDLEAARTRYGKPVPPLASEVLVRGIYQVIATRVANGEARHLPLLLDDLSYFWHTPSPEG